MPRLALPGVALPGAALSLLLAGALPSAAETLTLPSHVTAVTVYPQSAQVTRQVTFQAAAPGPVDLVIPDLPADTEGAGLRFAANAGFSLRSYALRSDRLPPVVAGDSPALAAARQGLQDAQATLRQAQAARDSILTRAEAADLQVAFLSGIKIDGTTLTPEALQALTQALGDQVVAARQAAILSRLQAAPADQAVDLAQAAVDTAQSALDALAAPDQDASDHMALILSVDLAQGGPVTLDITHFVPDAAWAPVYDLALDDKAQPASLTLGRGATVTQSTGEDWWDVSLTLSTARPGESSTASTLYPLLRGLADPQPPMAKAEGGAMDGMVMAEPAPAAMAPMTADLQGVSVVYHLPGSVSVATGVEDLRLALDSLTMVPRVQALAVPSRDATAFVVAEWVNTSAEVLLPGAALVSRDGTLVGGGALDLVPPGAKVSTGFGALDGVVLKRLVPDRSTGDHGVFTTSTEQHETAVLSVQNLTGQTWPLRLVDQVPYSETDDLRIDWTADPAPSETDVDGQRGILAWGFDLVPGATQTVTLTTRLSWPAGKVLQ